MKIIQKNFKLLGRTKARWWRKPSACTKSQHRKMRSQIDFIFLLAFSPLRGSSSAPPVIFKLLILHLRPPIVTTFQSYHRPFILQTSQSCHTPFLHKKLSSNTPLAASYITTHIFQNFSLRHIQICTHNKL